MTLRELTWLAAGRYEGDVIRVRAAVCAAVGGEMAAWLGRNPYRPDPPATAATLEAEAKEARADIAAVLGHLNAAAGVTSA